MAKSTIELPNGTIITVDGSPEEINKIISLYYTQKGEAVPSRVPKLHIKHLKKKEDGKLTEKEIVIEIVNHIKDCDEANLIEEKILDRPGKVNRVLLPLYIANKYIKDKVSLTTGSIYKVLKELGINIAQPNISSVIHNTASRYVMGDKPTKKGSVVRFKINRRGIKYISEVLEK